MTYSEKVYAMIKAHHLNLDHPAIVAVTEDCIKVGWGAGTSPENVGLFALARMVAIWQTSAKEELHKQAELLAGRMGDGLNSILLEELLRGAREQVNAELAEGEGS